MLSAIITFFSDLQHLDALIRWGGYTVLAVIVFAESGLFFGFFLPGDSLLVTAGLLASQGHLGLWEMIVLLSLMAIAGDSAGYYFGKTIGPRIFKREKSILFAKDHLLKAQTFYEKHGGKTIIMARFMPIVRTFAPIVAGAGNMAYGRFISFNIWGGTLWVTFMLCLGYFLGRVIPDVDRYIYLIILIIIFLSISPGLVAWLRSRQKPKN